MGARFSVLASCVADWQTPIDSRRIAINVVRSRFMICARTLFVLLMLSTAAKGQSATLGPGRQLAWPEEALRDGKIAAPSLSKATRVFQDNFDNPESGFPRGPVGIIERDYANGKYYIQIPGSSTFSIWNFPNPTPFLNPALQVSARVIGLGTDSWGIRINNYPFHWVNVSINNNGELTVDPDDDMEPGRGPRIGPIKHPAIKTNEKFNTLLLVIRGKVLEIYVNDVAVCDPVVSDRDMSPSLFSLRTRRREPATADKPEIRAEFDQVTIWSADSLKKPEARGAVVKTVTPTSPVPAELEKASPVFAGDLGNAKLVDDRLTLSNGPKATFAIEENLYQVLAKVAGHHRADISKLGKISNFTCLAFAKLANKADGGWGVTFGDTPAGKFEAQLREDSGSRQIRLSYITKDGDEDLIPWLTCPFARSVTENNALRVEALGKSIRLFVNGKFVAEKEDSRLVPGTLHPMVFAETAPVDARFSFFHVWRLKPPPPSSKASSTEKSSDK